MRGDIVMTEDREGAAKDLNNDKPEINKGVELLLRNRRRKPEAPKTFQIKFGNMFIINEEKQEYFNLQQKVLADFVKMLSLHQLMNWLH